MDGINLPSSIDWFSTTTTTLLVAIIGGTLNFMIKNEIKSERATKIITTAVITALGVILFWYNLVGIFYFFSALYTYQQKGCGASIFLWEETLQWNPKLIKARYWLIDCNTTLNHPQDSIPVFEKLQPQLSSSPEYWKQMSIVYFRADDYPKMQEALIRYADIESAESSKWILAVVHDLMDRKKYPEAEAAVKIVRVKNDANNSGVFWLAWALFEQKKYTEALQNFELCVERYRPDGLGYELGRCFAGEGFIYKNIGENSKAKQAFEFALFFYKDQSDVEKALSELP
jgi:tetratricopeptide (TPR) repeat protein